MCSVTEGLIPRMAASAQHCRLHRAYTRRRDDRELTCHQVRAIDLGDWNVRLVGHLDILPAANSTVSHLGIEVADAPEIGEQTEA